MSRLSERDHIAIVIYVKKIELNYDIQNYSRSLEFFETVRQELQKVKCYKRTNIRKSLILNTNIKNV